SGRLDARHARPQRRLLRGHDQGLAGGEGGMTAPGVPPARPSTSWYIVGRWTFGPRRDQGMTETMHKDVVPAATAPQDTTSVSPAPMEAFKQLLPDSDPQETREWIDALDGVYGAAGRERAYFLLRKVLKRARQLDIGLGPLVQTPYINTISPEQEAPFPGDEMMELRIRRIIRWNAAVMVLRANHLFAGIGGHLSTYASTATLYEGGFNHFFRGKDDGHSGDQVFFQGHASPGIYSRAFLEGRLSEGQLDHFRREVKRGEGLSSYPHPRLMPDFWEFPTVSMGLGPINAVYQARFNHYLKQRGLKDTSGSRVWAFVGDGEMD